LTSDCAEICTRSMMPDDSLVARHLRSSLPTPFCGTRAIPSVASLSFSPYRDTYFAIGTSLVDDTTSFAANPICQLLRPGQRPLLLPLLFPFFCLSHLDIPPPTIEMPLFYTVHSSISVYILVLVAMAAIFVLPSSAQLFWSSSGASGSIPAPQLFLTGYWKHVRTQTRAKMDAEAG